MTVDYTFAPILLDASPIPSRLRWTHRPVARCAGRSTAGRVSDYPWRYASQCPRWHRWPAEEHGNGPPLPPDPDAPTEERDGFALRFRGLVR